MNNASEDPSSAEDPEPSPPAGRRRRRRSVIGGLIATVAAMSLVGGWALTTADASLRRGGPSTGDASTAPPTTVTVPPKTLGTVANSPGLSAEFRRTFSDRFVETDGLRQHVVVGGEGPPLLLVHGWPENWYAWRLVMPELARHFTVIAPDQRGIGLTGKPRTGYDTGTLAKDLTALMDALGHERFSLVGHDTGMIIAYALAADFPERVERVAFAEVPGPPGVTPSPPLFVPEPLNNRLWHIPFNRVDDPLVERLVTGREDIFYGYEFAVQGGGVSKEAMDYYVRLLSDPETLTGSFGFYRAWDDTLAQNEKRATTKLTMPVLGIGGAESWGPAVADSFKGVATDVRGAVIPDAGHWLAEQAPDALLATLTEFLRTGGADASPLPAEK
ncbi:alpha/beta hydrolase [Streptomyces sp. NPDC006147]|uniref:alpha/beta fold hydrolase n=1 Tax=Streptomyces sp. NPDC006147 TaxID=3155597 RepID=UPI0033BDA0AE